VIASLNDPRIAGGMRAQFNLRRKIRAGSYGLPRAKLFQPESLRSSPRGAVVPRQARLGQRSRDLARAIAE
jgi:hypothetical protein